VADVGVHPREGELDLQQRRVVSAFKQGSPGFRHGILGRVVSLEPQGRERYVEVLDKDRVAEDLGTDQSGGDALGHGEVHAVEHRCTVLGRQFIADVLQAGDDVLRGRPRDAHVTPMR